MGIDVDDEKASGLRRRLRLSQQRERTMEVKDNRNSDSCITNHLSRSHNLAHLTII